MCPHCGAAQAVKNCVVSGVDCVEHGMLMDEEAVRMMKEAGTFYVPTMDGLYKVYTQERDSRHLEFAEFLMRNVLVKETPLSHRRHLHHRPVAPDKEEGSHSRGTPGY